jgi:hypothetical protein
MLPSPDAPAPIPPETPIHPPTTDVPDLVPDLDPRPATPPPVRLPSDQPLTPIADPVEAPPGGGSHEPLL